MDFMFITYPEGNLRANSYLARTPMLLLPSPCADCQWQWFGEFGVSSKSYTLKEAYLAPKGRGKG